MNSNIKTVIFWVVLIFVAVLLWTVVRTGKGRTEKQVNFSQFIADVESGKVKQVTINGTEVRGDYKDVNESFRTQIPVNYPDIYKALLDKGVITDVKEEAATEVVEFLKSRGYESTAIQGDAVEEDDVKRIVAKTVEKYGKLDCIVNSAGKIHWSPITEMELDGWRTCLYSYPTAAMLTTKHAAKAMIARLCKKCREIGKVIPPLQTRM